TRHVKCDEAKPTCRRCVLSGFRCDGYPTLPNQDDADYEAGETSSDGTLDGQHDSDAITMVNSSVSVSPTTTVSPASVVYSTNEVDKIKFIKREPRTTLTIAPTGPYKGNEQRSLQFFIDMTSVM
ncbi:hypothetical protein LTR66_016462, partial [Elasticomyces elasticus]